jgi:threonine dehydrogenase-like Zn-dependent dehydrogenase
MSCIIGAFKTSYHFEAGTYVHESGIRAGGAMAILAGAGPMGLGAIDYALHGGRRPELLAVTDIDDDRLDRARRLFPEAGAEKIGVKLVYVNTSDAAGSEARLRDLAGGKGFDDVLVMAPVAKVVESADRLLGRDGCLNFFAGPGRPDFTAPVNFYNVHYSAAHLVGTSGGNTDDMKEALELMAAGKINPAVMVTHVGGLNAVPEATLRLPEIPGGKKLIYTHIDMELTAIEAFREKGKSDPRFEELGLIIGGHNGLWSPEAEQFLLRNF